MLSGIEQFVTIDNIQGPALCKNSVIDFALQVSKVSELAHQYGAKKSTP